MRIRSRRLLLPAVPVFLLLCSASASPAGQKPAPSEDELARMDASIDALTKKVWPSVVQILVNSYGPREEASGGLRGKAGDPWQ